MYLLSKKPLSILVTVLGLGLGLGMSFAFSTPQTKASDADSSSSSGVTLAAVEVLSTTETSPLSEKAVATAPTLKASSTTADKPITFFAESGIAIRGADPVAYFTQKTYVAGSSKYTYDWGGSTWQFASAKHRDLFASNPQQYAPQYGGFCAWAVSQGYTAPVDPTAWDIVDGKLYLNFNARIQRRWRRDIPGHVARANQNWPGVLN